MMSVDILDSKHPSFRTTQAWFQFAISSSDKLIDKLILVEAKCEASVATIEYILSHDCHVSDNCFVISVMRQCPDIGMRSELIDEMPYVEFMLKIVDSDRLLASSSLLSCFRSSLSEDEKRIAHQISSSLIEEEDNKSVSRYLHDSETIESPAQTDQQEIGPDRAKTLMFALSNMGFQKRQVSRWVAEKGDSIHHGTIQDQIRDALKSLHTST